jgi:putative transposase
MGIHPEHSVAKLLKESKRASSIWIKSRGAAYTGFSWQRGYGAFSVSESIKSKVQMYIAHQEDHHRMVSFQDEWKAFMKSNGLALK